MITQGTPAWPEDSCEVTYMVNMAIPLSPSLFPSVHCHGYGFTVSALPLANSMPIFTHMPVVFVITCNSRFLEQVHLYTHLSSTKASMLSLQFT